MERDIGFPLTLVREDFYLLKINFKNFEHIKVHAMAKMVKIGADVLTVPMSPFPNLAPNTGCVISQMSEQTWSQAVTLTQLLGQGGQRWDQGLLNLCESSLKLLY